MNMFILNKEYKTVINVYIYTCGVVSVVVLLIVSSICAVCTSRVSNCRSNLSIRPEIWRTLGFKSTSCLLLLRMWCLHWHATFSKFIDFSVASMPFTTPLMDFVTCKNKSHQPARKKTQGRTDFKAPCLFYLIHRDGCLDSGSHCVHPSAHPQEIHRLVLLSDGILCMDPRNFHIPLLDSLEATQIQSTSANIFRGQNLLMQIVATDSLLTFFTLTFSVFSSLSHFFEFLFSSFAANFKLKRFSRTWVKEKHTTNKNKVNNDVSVSIIV